MATSTLDHLWRSTPIVAIIRSSEPCPLTDMIDVLSEADIRTIEVTLTTPGALDAINARAHGSDGVMIGAGTVRTVAEVADCAAAGAEFLITPSLDLEVVAMAVRMGVPIIPGCFTPTELVAAHHAGAVAAKLFPAAGLGPAYLHELLKPLPELAVVPVGGIGLEDVDRYLDAGARAVGLGSALLGTAISDGNLDQLAERVRSLVAGVRARP